MELNKIYNEDCLEGMKKIESDSIDLVVTSPPYDNLRDYKGFNFDFYNTAGEIYRVVKDGGVVVWVVGDATNNGSESGTSFRQALYFMELGFKLHDTMIFAKNNPIPLTHRRYEQQFEYMFVFSKGKPKTFNPIKIPSKNTGQKSTISHRRKSDDLEKGSGYGKLKKKDKIKPNIWFYNVGNSQSSSDKIAYKHPAIFPEKLARDHIVTWSNEGETVLDPFMGSGTTAISCIDTNRNYIGFEISEEYCGISNDRIKKHKEEMEK